MTSNGRFHRIRTNADGVHAELIQTADDLAHHGLSCDFNTGALETYE
jgi:hypothetical protein